MGKELHERYAEVCNSCASEPELLELKRKTHSSD